MKVSIKELENGWLVHYETWASNWHEEYKTGEEEKAFAYDFDDEHGATWLNLIDFLREKFGIDNYLRGIEREKKEGSK